MALDYTYPTPLPSTKGWGPGWPECDRTQIVPHPIFQGGVNIRIEKLVNRLVRELKKQGYTFHDGWSWGFGCRGTKDSSGSTGGTPSFHSWGLALDFNAPINAFGADRENTQLGTPEYAYVRKLMKEYGFFWLGPSIGDWMHFSFCGSPKDADAMLKKAIVNHLGEKDPVYLVMGRMFKKLGPALDRAKDLLKRGKDTVIKVR